MCYNPWIWHPEALEIFSKKIYEELLNELETTIYTYIIFNVYFRIYLPLLEITWNSQLFVCIAMIYRSTPHPPIPPEAP